MLSPSTALGFKLETGLGSPGAAGSKNLDLLVDPLGDSVSNPSKSSTTIEEVQDSEQRRAGMTPRA